MGTYAHKDIAFEFAIKENLNMVFIDGELEQAECLTGLTGSTGSTGSTGYTTTSTSHRLCKSCQDTMLDEDQALLYGVETKVLNQAVKRNSERFPEEFMFQITDDEFNRLRSQIVTSNQRGGRRYLPYAFTEQVKRKIKHFPSYFMFQLTEKEIDLIVSQNAIPSKQHLGGSLPFVFTEQAVGQLT